VYEKTFHFDFIPTSTPSMTRRSVLTMRHL